MKDSSEALLSALIMFLGWLVAVVFLVLLAVPCGLYAHLVWRAIILGWGAV